MFIHELGQPVKVSISGETGHVKGRSDYTNCENQYLLHMKAADGRAVDIWFAQSEIEAVTS